MVNWCTCVGHPAYEVSDEGDVRRIGKATNLAHVPDKDGYIVHVFSYQGKRTNVMVHKLMAEAFIGPCPMGNVVRHKNGVRDHNVISNIEYGTPKQNSEDMLKHGTQANGERQHLSKLKEVDVRAIRASTKTQSELAKEYGVARSNISFIIRRITWKYI